MACNVEHYAITSNTREQLYYRGRKGTNLCLCTVCTTLEAMVLGLLQASNLHRLQRHLPMCLPTLQGVLHLPFPT